VDGKLVVGSLGKIALAIVNFIIRELRRLLLCLLLGGELLFAGYSLFKLALHGPAEVLNWWEHLQIEGGPLERAFEPFSWSQFFKVHLVMLGLAAVLWYFERRYQRARRVVPKVGLS
jgi:hypothetical protein